MEKALDQFLTQTYIMDKVLSHVDVFNDASKGVLNPQELGKLNKLSKRLADASSSTRNLLEMRDKFVRRNLEKKNKEVDEMLSKFQVPITCPAKPQMPGGRILEKDETIEKDGISMRKPHEETGLRNCLECGNETSQKYMRWYNVGQVWMYICDYHFKPEKDQIVEERKCFHCLEMDISVAPELICDDCTLRLKRMDKEEE